MNDKIKQENDTRLQDNETCVTEHIPQVSLLEADKEGLLRGGFAMFGSRPCGHTGINGNCSCNNNASGCMGNDNCQCNAACAHNCDCNCNCVTTASPTEPTGATNASCQPMTGIGLFTF